METVKSFLKREPVLVISGLLAAASVFLVPPSAEYLSYVDLRTLGILFCLMAAVAGLTDAGLFALLVRKLSAGVGTVRKLCLLLTGACFLFSMFITNDVALLTFVPLTIALLAGEGQRTLILAVVSETIAANIGSALTPFGNPQNLFLYSRYGMGLGQFFSVTGPICLLGFLLTFGGLLLARPENAPLALPGGAGEERPFSGRRAAFFAGLFLLSLLAVLRLLDWKLAFAATALLLALFARPVFRRVDYSLLLTFVFFFILVGNLSRIPAVSSWISSLLAGREAAVSALVSQAISNVPAALMLAEFTDNWQGLLAGTNIGGLGTLVASMASLISFRLYARTEGAKPGRYFAVFSFYNFLYLAVLLAAWQLILKGVSL